MELVLVLLKEFENFGILCKDIFDLVILGVLSCHEVDYVLDVFVAEGDYAVAGGAGSVSVFAG